jgi:hypothetical protein
VLEQLAGSRGLACARSPARTSSRSSPTTASSSGTCDEEDQLNTRPAQRLGADPGVPAGVKFETFLYTDRILGLDLPRDIARA